MKGSRPLIAGMLAGVVLAGCGSEPTPPPPPPPPPPPSPVAQCGSQTPLQLSVGQHQVVDPAATNGCVRVPQAGPAGAEYIVVVASAASNRSTAGISGGYFVRSSNPGASSVASAAPSLVDAVEPPPTRTTVADQFHMMLRQREAGLSADPSNRTITAAPNVAAVPPVVGDVRTFKACKNLACNLFDDVTATARYVGTKAAIYMDNAAPATADTLQDPDYQDLGSTFDTYHYPIDAAAFGTESDIDNNDRIVILMTKSVNALTPDCTNGRVLGYFFGLDLITTGSQAVNSNKAEIFYTFVPAPSAPPCAAINRVQTLYLVKPTLIHELQHMISWNKRVIQGSGNAEETWLNEAMSHFAEELGGRLIPANKCPFPSGGREPSCRSQYTSGDIVNTYDYLTATEDHFLIYPTSSNGTLEERGASWNFLRWVIDQFATDTLVGSDLTPSLVTGPGGAATIVARTGQSMAQLVPEWLLASYLDDLTGFAGVSPRLRFKSWGLRTIFTNPANQGSANPPGPFNGFPLRPDSTSGAYTRTGTLRGGSGRHFRLIQQANGPGIDFQLLKDATGTVIDPALVARIGIARVR